MIQNYRRWLHGRELAFVIVVVVAVVVAIAVIASGGSDSSGTTGSSAAVGSTAPAGSTGTPSTASTATLPHAPATTIGSILVTIAGQVRSIEANGAFVINDGKVDYTVEMSPATKVVDLNGTEASADGIRVDGSAQVTGLLSGTTIAAETVTIPTPATDVPATT